MSNSYNSRGGYFSPISAIITILVLTALWFGLPTQWGLFEIDIFPPAIRLTP